MKILESKQINYSKITEIEKIAKIVKIIEIVKIIKIKIFNLKKWK